MLLAKPTRISGRNSGNCHLPFSIAHWPFRKGASAPFFAKNLVYSKYL